MDDSRYRFNVLEWNKELIARCCLAQAEIYFGREAYTGVIGSVCEGTDTPNVLVVKITSLKQKSGEPTEGALVEDREFVLTECYQPLNFKDSEYEGIHVGCKEGRLAIYFKKPCVQMKGG